MKRIALITLILGTALAVAPAANAVVMSDGAADSSGVVFQTDVLSGDGIPTGLSQAEYQALLVRGEALNQQYGIPTGLSQAEYQALLARGEALNQKYGSVSTPQVAVTGSGDSFAWDTVGIGAAALAGAMLLAIASLAATRRRHQLGF